MISCADLSTRGRFGGRLKQPDENDPENLGGGGLIFNYGSCFRNRLGRYDRINDIVCGVVNQTILMKRAGTL